eukprot:2989928-Ditylum_brightwellii.AAC.1
MAKILDADYCNVDLWTDIVDQCDTLSTKDDEPSLRILKATHMVSLCLFGQKYDLGEYRCIGRLSYT